MAIYTGGAGAGTYTGGAGNDQFRMTVDESRDVVNGLGGTDTVDFSGTNRGLTITLGESGQAGSVTADFGFRFYNPVTQHNFNTLHTVETTALYSIENVIASNGRDTITGNSQNNVLTGGGGRDVITGGGGSDTFDFNLVSESTVANPDKIMDFQSGVDWIDLSGIDADTNLSGNQAFHFPEGQIGTMSFTGEAGELIWNISGSDWSVQADTNGDSVADFSLVLHNAANTTFSLGSDDFLM